MSLQGLAKNVNFGPNLVVFGPKNPNSDWKKQKFWYPHNGKNTYAPCLHCILVWHETKWAKNANIWPKTAYFGPNLGFFGPKIPIIREEAKVSVPM